MKHRSCRSRALGVSALALGLAALPHAPAAADGLACQVSYTMASTASRFTLDLTIGNTGTAAIDGWTLRFTVAPGQVVSRVKAAMWAQTGGSVVAVNILTNGAVPAGTDVPVAFSGTHSGDTSPPRDFTVNNVPCAAG